VSKPKVNEAQYAELVNNKMKEHDQYKNGMGVKLNPEGAIRPAGLTVIGGNDARSIMSWAENKVRNEYELVVTP
jgi:hypothetical protein